MNRARTSKDKDRQDKQSVGVADYFSVLGVGEELVWNHAQQKISEEDEQKSSFPEEDDALLLERFYREILDCRIIVVDEKPQIDYQNTSAYLGASNSIPSPSPSDVASGIGTDSDTFELEGWTIVNQTRPAGVYSATNTLPPSLLWRKGQVWDANLDPIEGLSSEILSLDAQIKEQQSRKSSTPLKDLRKRVTSTFSHRQIFPRAQRKKFYLSYRRRAPDESSEPAIADILLQYVKLHKVTLDMSFDNKSNAGSSVTATTVSQLGAAALLSVAKAGKEAVQSRMLGSPTQSRFQNLVDVGEATPVALNLLLELPSGFHEWSIPERYQLLYFPSERPDSTTKTVLFQNEQNQNTTFESGAEIGFEAVEEERFQGSSWEEFIQPKLVDEKMEEDEEFIYVPILAIRRQKVGEEERFKEDPAIVDITVSFWDEKGQPMPPSNEAEDEDDDDVGFGLRILQKTDWETAMKPTSKKSKIQQKTPSLGSNCLMIKRNIPLGFCDAAFKTTVLDRFPLKNYKGLPLPEEELPMFCYPTGCRLHRAKFRDAPLPQYYGFVVKNERGESIYVSCVSFMEPLIKRKEKQLTRLSKRRKRVSLPHARFCERLDKHSEGVHSKGFVQNVDDMLTGFDDMATFENKTICLVSRYPYWTAFRRFLSHLHSMAGTSSELPLERYISHLLLTVPVPKPAGPSILIPLPTFNIPMMLWSPALKDLPLLDLPFERLVSCLDIPTIVTVVLGFLALERKVIVMSTRPSLVLDVCELLRSLLFPFDLCAPYVPRLTEPFIRTLDFPGAIFVGIHDDGTKNGLAAVVRKNMPEDSTIVDLDSGTVDCSGDGTALLNSSWGVIPPGPRSILVSEVETLCRDAGLVPGQEPLDSQIDQFFDVSLPSALVEDEIPLRNTAKEPLDDRAIRDAFLRFFCSVLGGYERYLVVPDVDFLISGNEWFDSQGFLASASEEKSAFLGALVSTQLFQSFIQRRTEASDVHCLLFDECVAEFHSSTSISPYGRLGGDVETVQGTDGETPKMLYSLLVDQSATESFAPGRSFDTDSRPGSDTDSSGQYMSKGPISISDDFAINATGDWVTIPSRQDLPEGCRYIYCIDGNATFPDRMNPKLYFPRQPESWLVEMSTLPTPMLTRSEKEIEEADRRRKLATSFRGLQNQRRCLWQLPKLMGSHFLGTWLLCVPTMVAQPNISHERESKYLLYALGALRILRGKQRIIPDEAAYRALIVACGRTKSDRRMELVKLFGLLRSDGIFPSAVTLGQYTRALAEGYSKRSIGVPEEDTAGAEVSESSRRDSKAGSKKKNWMDPETLFCALDRNNTILEDAGRRWRQRSTQGRDTDPSSSTPYVDRQKKKSNKPWLPVATSSSFVPPFVSDIGSRPSTKLSKESICILAIWSRTKACDSCGYIPLDEEVQAGWDVFRKNDTPGAISCPRCTQLYIPMLGYRELSVEEALAYPGEPTQPKPDSHPSYTQQQLPPQIRGTVEDTDAAYVTYISPASLRVSLERLIEEYGEEVLERENLKALDPELFYNFWFYCSRFSLPLPLPVSNTSTAKHYFAFSSWDHGIATRACYSCAKVLRPLFLEDLQNPNILGKIEAMGEHPLLSRFNLQGYYSNVWDHEDLSEILVTLVEACDKRDFRPVVERLLLSNKRRKAKYAPTLTSETSSDIQCSPCSVPVTDQLMDNSILSTHLVELDLYRTILYLAKYQCTTAFHAFFPAVLKPCKGYHFWVSCFSRFILIQFSLRKVHLILSYIL